MARNRGRRTAWRGYWRLALPAWLGVPLTALTGWQPIMFAGHSPNRFAFDTTGLHIAVASSASALFYPLSPAPRVRRLRVAGDLGGLPQLAPDAVEGRDRGDDYALRIGLVFGGTHRLTWLERWIAPGWVKDLTRLLGDAAIGETRFWVVSQRTAPGTVQTLSERYHWKSIVASRVAGPGPFTIDVPPGEAEPCLGVWVQSDGDDSRSAFAVTVHRLELEIAE
jgi:hypothetical protein